MTTRCYRPDLSVKFAPRVPLRLRKAVKRVCRANDMPESDVLRYSFEAIVLLVESGKLRFRQTPRIHLTTMVTMRTSRGIARKTHVILERLQAQRVGPAKPHHPQQTEVEYADLLRGLIDMAITIAGQKGMAHMIALRERAL